jgi:hypothetical protein
MRVSDRTHQRVVSLASATGHRMSQVLDDAVSAYEREVFWSEFAEGYDQLADDPAAWEEVLSERKDEEVALQDGLG